MERLDRNYVELLQELRVLQAGTQILFAFLLSLAFQSQFVGISEFERVVYVVTLVCGGLSTACFIAPAAFHRVVFRRGMKGDLLVATTRYVVLGMCFLFLAMTGAILLVLDFLIGLELAAVISAVLAICFLSMWVVAPMLARTEDGGGYEPIEER